MNNLELDKILTRKETKFLDKYIDEVYKIKPLSNDEEYELIKLIKEKGDQQALKKIVEANLRFVIHVAKEYQNEGLTLPDLILAGNNGLIKAVHKFDDKSGVKFINYAIWWVRSSILKALGDAKVVDKDSSKLNSQKNKDRWDINLKISNNDDSKSIYSLWLLLEALKTIENLEFKIEQLSKGSIITKIKVWFKSEEAKKEAEELLESTKKLAKGKLERDYYENEKNKNESEKINIEKEKIQSEMNLINSDEQKKRRKLEIEALEIENENKRLENERLKLKVFLERKQALTELLSDGIINNDEYILAINNTLQIHKNKDNSIEIGVLK